MAKADECLTFKSAGGTVLVLDYDKQELTLDGATYYMGGCGTGLPLPCAWPTRETDLAFEYDDTVAGRIVAAGETFKEACE